MKRYKFLSGYMKSNSLSIKGSSHKFNPNQIYDGNEVIELFVEAHPNRWDEILSFKVSLDEKSVNKPLEEITDENVNKEKEDTVFVDEESQKLFEKTLEDDDKEVETDVTENALNEELDSDIVAFNEFIETDGDVEEYLNELHYTKIKQIAEYLSIPWTKKDDTIKGIVESL